MGKSVHSLLIWSKQPTKPQNRPSWWSGKGYLPALCGEDSLDSINSSFDDIKNSPRSLSVQQTLNHNVTHRHAATYMHAMLLYSVKRTSKFIENQHLPRSIPLSARYTPPPLVVAELLRRWQHCRYDTSIYNVSLRQDTRHWLDNSIRLWSCCLIICHSGILWQSTHIQTHRQTTHKHNACGPI